MIPASRALALPRPQVPPSTRRQARLASQRRRRRTTVLSVLSASLLVLAVGVLVIPLLARTEGRVTSAATSDAATGAEPTAAGADASIFVLVTHQEDPEAPADSITLLGLNPDTGRGAAVFVPVGLLLEMPGIGLERAGLAQRYGGVGLVQDSLADALDLDIDAAVALDQDALADLLGAGGELTVDVGDTDLVGTDDEQVSFEAGEQPLDGQELVDYWTLRAADEQQLSELPRQQQILTALLDRIAQDPDILDRALTAGSLDPASTAGPEALRAVLTGLADAHEQGQLAFQILPVQPFGGVAQDGTSTYRIGDEAETTLVSLLRDGGGQAGDTRVEVRDGIGQRELVQRVQDAHQVEQALGDGFRVTLGEPAPDEAAGETQIIIYADTPEARERAEAVRERLGVGTITVDEQPQTVVDVTIVLGDDFPAGGGDDEEEQET